MILDGSLQFDGAAGTFTPVAITATAVSTNVLDMVNARDMGIGDQAGATPKLLILIGTTFTTTNSATLTVQFQGSTDNSTFTTYAESDAMAAATLVAGAKLLPIDLPHRKPGAAIPRYYRLNYVVGTGVFSAGTILYAGLVLTRDDIPAYPPGVTVAN